MKVVGFIKTIDEIRDLLLTDELFMSICGFNAHQIKNGSCDQGTKLRKTPSPKIRGSLCVDTVPTILSPVISRLRPEVIEKAANSKKYSSPFMHGKSGPSMMGTSKNQNFGSRSRHAKILTAGIHRSISRIKI